MTRRRGRSSYYADDWPSYSSSPIRVQDGIKAKSRSGKFVENWWADRWIKVLRGLMDSGRLSRGRSYARNGQVLNIDVEAGAVSARVQGSRRTPYKVKIQLEPLSDRQWEVVLDALSEQALFSAQLLNGEMPPEVEDVFKGVGVPLFPTSSTDLVTDCSCPDWANPCKHIAAVYYLLGERFDEDPFLLFELRGRSQDEVAAALRGRRSADLDLVAEERAPYLVNQLEAVEVPPLEESLDVYWEAGAQLAEMLTEMVLEPRPPEVDLALLKRLGVPDFVPSGAFRAQMERVYEGVTARALEVAYGERELGD
jgi:uncharacterized Zn finger protein